MKPQALLRSCLALLLSAGMLLPVVACTRPGEGSTTTADSTAPHVTGATTGEQPPAGDPREVTLGTHRVTDGMAFSSLPLGSVRADSWLEHQALLLAENLTGDFEKLSPDCKATGSGRSGWLGGTGENWERGPYYVRGLVALAYVLDSEPLKEQAQKWIDWAIESQTETGAFGPFAETPEKVDYWSLMPMLMAIELYADATGDERVVPFLQKYFDWQYEALGKRPLADWATERGGDNILAVYWLMEKTGDRSYEKLCERLYEQTSNWSARYDRDAWSGSYHIVNMQESFKLFPIMFALTGEEKYLDTYYKGIENLYMAGGRADGMSNGDEVNQNIFATHGSETCAVVERMLCDEIALTLLRDASIADHLEDITYNALPQQLLPDGRGQVYFTMQNQIDASLGSRGFSSDGGDRSVYGAPGGFPCCVHNYQMGWPLFIASLWMTTSDGGLAVGAYGPSHVTATVGQGTRVTLTETTNYPYEETVTLTLSADKTDTYPLYLRVPSWCDPATATIRVNGHEVSGTLTAGEYFTLTAAWEDGDTVELTFPRRLSVEYGENHSISVRYGGLLFALSLAEKWTPISYNPLGWATRVGSNRYTSYAITTTDSWNMALVDLDPGSLEESLSITQKSVPADMAYTVDAAPIIITAKARRVSGWGETKHHTAGPIPISPLSPEALEGEVTTVTLIPYAHTRLRMTMIPWTGDATVTHEAAASREGDALVFDNVIVPANRSADGSIVADVDYTVCLASSLESESRFDVRINRQLAGSVTLPAGEGSVTLSGKLLDATRRNRVELIPVDGRELPAPAAITLTLLDGDREWSRYEAEDGRLQGSAKAEGDLVVGITAEGSGVTIPTVPCIEAGTYTLRVAYKAPAGEATLALYADDVRITTLQMKQTPAGEMGYVDVSLDLPVGIHALRLTRRDVDSGTADIDAISLRLDDIHPVTGVVGEDGSGFISRHEAEKAQLTGGCYATGTHVAGIDKAGDSLTFTIQVPSNGSYIIRSYHCAPLGAATHTLLIDGVEQGKLRYSQVQASWGAFDPAVYGELTITLTAGSHTLTIARREGDTGFAELDAMELWLSGRD